MGGKVMALAFNFLAHVSCTAPVSYLASGCINVVYPLSLHQLPQVCDFQVRHPVIHSLHRQSLTPRSLPPFGTNTLTSHL
jgi:hypothetical protein